MRSPKDKFDRQAVYFGIALSLVGVLGLLGWLTRLLDLAKVYPSYVPIPPDTAVIFIILGLVIALALGKYKSGTMRGGVSVVLALLALYGFLKILQYILPSDHAATVVLFPVSFVKRMSPLTGAIIFLAGITGLVHLFLKNRNYINHIISGVGVLILMAGFGASVGYIFGTPLLYGGDVMPISTLSAGGFLLLGCGFIALAGPQSIFVKYFVGTSSNAKLLRVILPLIISAILIQGFLCEVLSKALNIQVALITAVLSLVFVVLIPVIIIPLTRIIFHQADQAQAERQKIEERNHQLASIIEFSDDAIIGKTLDGIITSWNTGAEKIYGYTESEVLNQPISLIIPTDHHKEMVQILEKIRSGQRIHHYETVRRRKDGTLINVSVAIAPMANGDGQIIGASTVARDITARKRAEDAVLQSEEKFRAMFESNSAAIAIIEPDTTISMVNDAYCHISGYTRQEVIGMSWTKQIPPDDLGRLKEYNRLRLENPQLAPNKYEFKFYRKDGTIRYALMSISMMEVNRKIITSFIDVTDSKQAEKELRKLSRAVDQSPASIVITDTNGAIEYVNPKFIQLTGYSFEEARGQNPRILKSDEKPSEEYKQLWELITAGKEWRGEFHNKKKNGDTYWESASISPIKDAQGNVTHFLAVKEDITQRKQAEEEREKLIKELQFALDNVKTLQGLIPICANCKKIRDDSGYWQQVESYIQRHSDAKFTHGICPECAVILYPGYSPKAPDGSNK
jgi:PAS domain S-box-containing protein